MTSVAARRLAKLEGALPPREAVLAWLIDAHQFPSLEDHARTLAALPVEAAPLSVIGARIEASVRASMKGQPSDALRDAVRRAVGDGAFLFSLVLGLNSEALDFARLEGLRAAAAFFWMGSILGGPRADDLPPAEAGTYVRERADAWELWRTVVDRLSLDVRVETDARTTLERRFFGSHEVYFSDVSQTWAGLVDMVERLVSLADALAPITGSKVRSRRSKRGADRSLTDRVAERVAWLADDARVRAYEIMGDRPRAVAIVERRLLMG